MVAMVLFLIGGMFAQTGPFGIMLLIAGLVCFSGVVVFQLINLPVEFDASARAKQLLSMHGIVDERGAAVVRDVLNAAAWTYVAATLQSILQMVYFAFQIFGRDSGNR